MTVMLAAAIAGLLQSSSALDTAHESRKGWWRVTDDPGNRVRFVQTGFSKSGQKAIYFYRAPGRSLERWRRDVSDGDFDLSLELGSFCIRESGTRYRCYDKFTEGPLKKKGGCVGKLTRSNMVNVAVRKGGGEPQLVVRDLTRACSVPLATNRTCKIIRCLQYHPMKTYVYSDDLP